MNALRAALIAFLALSPAALDAQVSRDSVARDSVARRLDRVVITGSRRPQRLKDSPVTVEIISAEDVRRSGASDLASLLLERSGIDLQGGHPTGEGAMLQGIGAERVLILVDGQPLAGRLSGVTDISRIPTAVIQSVEVVKGPQSTLYGSEAMGGVINVITRGPIRGMASGSASMLTGSDGRLDTSVGATRSFGTLSLGGDFGHRTVDRAPGRGVTTGSFAERFDYAGKAAWDVSDEWSANASVFALSERQRWQTGAAYLFADNVQLHGRVGASRSRGAHRLSPGLFLSRFENLSRGSDRPRPYADDAGDRQVQQILEAELMYSGPLRGALVDGGVEIRRDETVSDRIVGRRRHLTTWEPFAQAQIPVGTVTLVPGARVSASSQWGTHLSPRLALKAPLKSLGVLRASVSRGFRAPDFKELFMFFQNTSAGYSVRGNPDLRPELSVNASLGAELTRGGLYGRAQLFWNEFDRFIETRLISAPSQRPVFEYANIDKGSTRGVELEGAVDVASARLESSLALLATRDRQSGQSLLGRPSRTARIALSGLDLLGLDLTMALAYTGSAPVARDAQSGAISRVRSSYTRTDMRVARDFGRFEISAGADNVFDARPRDWPGFSGRQVYAGMSWLALGPVRGGSR